MSYSNQFPRQQDIEKRNYSITEKANIILGGLRENLPNLYDYIMNTNKKK